MQNLGRYKFKNLEQWFEENQSQNYLTFRPMLKVKKLLINIDKLSTLNFDLSSKSIYLWNWCYYNCRQNLQWSFKFVNHENEGIRRIWLYILSSKLSIWHPKLFNAIYNGFSEGRIHQTYSSKYKFPGKEPLKLLLLLKFEYMNF